MAQRYLARAASAFVVLVLVAGAAAADVPKSGNAVFDKAVEIVDENFYSKAALPAFHEAVNAIIAKAAEGKTPLATDEAMDKLIAALQVSHTGRFTPDQVDYYELTNVFRYSLRDSVRRLFPPKGEITYEGIGIASKKIGDGLFITDVYDGGPAARAGLMAGDEILSADRQPFAEIGSFKGKAGSTVTLDVLRKAGGAPIAVPVSVEKIEPLGTYLKAITDSVKVIDRDGRKIGVIHIWTFTSDEVSGILNEELATRLKDVDGLVVDLRSRWGGGPGDAAESFVGGSADMEVIDNDGEKHFVNTRFHKPVVAIIDEGTRSSMEILAYSLKKNGVPLVGTPTAGDVLAARAFPLPDDSIFELAVADVVVDGKKLEANPVTPDIAVPFDIRYAAGADPQMDAALSEMGRRLATD
jgi:carboxyl-terminal processing protease